MILPKMYNGPLGTLNKLAFEVNLMIFYRPCSLLSLTWLDTLMTFVSPPLRVIHPETPQGEYVGIENEKS